MLPVCFSAKYKLSTLGTYSIKQLAEVLRNYPHLTDRQKAMVSAIRMTHITQVNYY